MFFFPSFVLVCVVDDRPSHEKSPTLEILSDVMCAADSIIKSPKSYTQLEEERKVKNEHRSHTGRDEKSSSHKTVSLIHTGGILGDLPSLQNGRSPKNIGVNEGISNDISRALDYGNQGSEFPGVQGGGMSSPTGSKNFNLDSRADGKDTNNRYSNKTVSSTGKLKSKKKDHITLPPGFPPSYLCQLSQRPMNDPVKSIYGNVFDRPVILRWMGMQGHICPLSGQSIFQCNAKCRRSKSGMCAVYCRNKFVYYLYINFYCCDVFCELLQYIFYLLIKYAYLTALLRHKTC